MADKQLSGLPPPSPSSPSHQNGRIRGMTPKCSPPPQHNGSLEAGTGQHSTSNTSAVPPSTRTSASTSPFRTLRTLGGLVTPVPRPGPEGCHSFTRSQGQSLSAALSSMTRTMTSSRKCWSSQQEEPEALLDLILECQGQRLEDQRASLNLLPDTGAAALCGACNPDQPTLPSLDFYYMLIQYQSDRMEDQRCPLPDVEDVVGSVPEGQEDFFSLIQRAQSRRMDEQRASLLLTHTEDDHNAHITMHTAGSSSRPLHHHHHHQ